MLMSCPRNRKLRLVCWTWLMCTVFAGTSAGPDGNPFPSCKVFQTYLNAYARQTVGYLVQGIQARDASLGSLRLGRLYASANATPSEASLRSSKDAMYSQLRDLLLAAGIPSQAGLSGIDAAVALAMSCMSSQLLPASYIGRPVVSIMLNYFKRRHVVKEIAENMHAACLSVSISCELVVNVDNPEEAGAWANEAGFVVPVFSANLHESRGYNRAARLARGKYLVVWQDDQIPPRTGIWLLQMVRLFETYPRLGILGMNTYRICRQKEITNRWGQPGWDPDPRTGITWSFVHFADFAPMAIVASIFWELGGLEEGFSRPGDCGITGDWELCARAWVAGWQVGHFSWEGRKGDPEPGSTHTSVGAVACWNRQMDVGGGSFTKRYIHPVFVQDMCERVWAHNMLTFTLPSPDRCPYGEQTRGWANCTAPPAGQRTAFAAQMQVQLPFELDPTTG
ncbi:hypothetical protein VaNZ11_005552 [Volvox africanus]|uniref:Glycosyltransferase 2-like domain-containing protein n=1 Tax=Volvox africanus TaxID=51714 RepID=A0ABQ5S012_9CHLO|nr:hypothetical protein VaNZ11_005552 [Volvox africanus]